MLLPHPCAFIVWLPASYLIHNQAHLVIMGSVPHSILASLRPPKSWCIKDSRAF